jgi:hypothetical protein
MGDWPFRLIQRDGRLVNGAGRRVQLELQAPLGPLVEDFPISSLGWGQPKASPSNSANEVSAVYRFGSGFDGERPKIFMNVVVIALKRNARNSQATGKTVQFIEAVVTDKVTPQSTPPFPATGIYKYPHLGMFTQISSLQTRLLGGDGSTYCARELPFTAANSLFSPRSV